MMLHAWQEHTPPRSTWVAASYGVIAPLQVVKTCKHGCCVQHPVCGSMMLPRYWRAATEAEIESAEQEIADLAAKPPINFWELYAE